MIFAYARISTETQNFDLQLDAFSKENIDPKNIYRCQVVLKKRERV